MVYSDLSNIQSYYFLLIGQVRELDRLHKDSYLCNQERSSDSVTFGHFFQNLVTFGHLFRLLFEYTEDYFNQLRVIAFDSYQEYTIANDTAISARGTIGLCKLLIFNQFANSYFYIHLFWSLLVTFRRAGDEL